MVKVLKIGVSKKRSLKSLIASLKEARQYLAESLRGDINVSDICLDKCQKDIHSLHCQIVNYKTSEKWEK